VAVLVNGIGLVASSSSVAIATPFLFDVGGNGCVFSHSARALTLGSMPAVFHHAASSLQRWTSRWWPRHNGTVNSSLTLRPSVMRKTQMMGVSWPTTTADKAGLLKNKAHNDRDRAIGSRLTVHKDGFIDRQLMPGKQSPAKCR
jgi:hypothetical protein